MSTKIDLEYHCDKCGYAKKRTKFKRVFMLIMNWTNGLVLALTFLLVMSFAFHGAFYNEATSWYGGFLFDRWSAEHSGEVRELAVNLTDGCVTSDVLCNSYNMYVNMKDEVRYISKSPYILFYEPLDVINGKTYGDCSGWSSATVSLLRSLGLKANNECSIENRHCFAIAYDELREVKYIIDFTIPEFVALDINEDPWNYKKSNIMNIDKINELIKIQ